MKEIKVKKACLHNLKNIDVKIPKDKFVVVTGVSGSGKSSLIFDTIYEAGRRGYLQAIGMLPAIDENEYYDSIEGIGPTIAVKQKIIRESNPRSIVGTRTGIIDYLRVLYSMDGKTNCSICGSSTNDELICTECGNQEERLISGYFSFNSPYGMCYRCKGRGYITEVKTNKIIQDENMNLMEICLHAGFPTARAKREVTLMLKHFGVDIKTPFKELSEEVKDIFLKGGNYSEHQKFWGIIPFLRYKAFKDRAVEGITERSLCPECNGFKLCQEALDVTINGLNIGEVSNLTITELKDFLEGYRRTVISSKSHVLRLLEIIISKLNNLTEVGLSYLSLGREMPTLSGGEVQRLFLMAHLESQVESLIYIFDEPTCGLHEIEKKNLIEKIKKLRENNNTVIVVEHDKNSIESAEHIIDFGPLAGVNGGQIVYSGDVAGLLNCENSITGKYLSGKIKMPHKTENDFKKINEFTKWVKINNINVNNLKNTNLSIPLGCITGIAGVSGSGKSSLISDTLVPVLKKYFRKSEEDDKCDASYGEENIDENDLQLLKAVESIKDIKGLENISDFAEVSQAQIGRNKRSIAATYLGIWDNIRELFAATQKATKEKLGAGYFSFNSKGACDHCKGTGYTEKFLGELGTMTSVCEECHGRRYKDKVLEIKYKDKSIAQVLEMSIEEGTEFFKEEPYIFNMLDTVIKSGMGYLKLGQPTPTLSGGEAQRIKLANELGKLRDSSDGKEKDASNNKLFNKLFILDEPTTGLSFFDTANLLRLIKELADEGNSIIIVEHDPGVLSYCDWIIELGPGGGKDGGEIIAEGSPTELKKNSNSIIGEFLNEY